MRVKINCLNRYTIYADGETIYNKTYIDSYKPITKKATYTLAYGETKTFTTSELDFGFGFIASTSSNYGQLLVAYVCSWSSVFGSVLYNSNFTVNTTGLSITNNTGYDMTITVY